MIRHSLRDQGPEIRRMIEFSDMAQLVHDDVVRYMCGQK